MGEAAAAGQKDNQNQRQRNSHPRIESPFDSLVGGPMGRSGRSHAYGGQAEREPPHWKHGGITAAAMIGRIIARTNNAADPTETTATTFLAGPSESFRRT